MDKARYLYSELSTAIQARKNCDIATPRNTEWFDRWTERIEELSNLLPHGSGIDNGTIIDMQQSHAEKLVLHTSFHHMTDAGFYDGWTEHTVVVTPSFTGINLRISGRDRNQIKEYLYDTFSYALEQEVSAPFGDIPRSMGSAVQSQGKGE
jgi:hypothetical protein